MQVEEQIIETETPIVGIPTNGHRQHNLQLLLANLDQGTQRLREGSAIAFTSASEGVGVSHVTQLFAAEMARYTGRRTLIINADRLQSLGIEDYLQMPWNCHPTNIDNLWMLPSKKKSKRSRKGYRYDDEPTELPKRTFLTRVAKDQDEIDTGLNSVDALRVNFDNILVDCRALRDSSEAAVLASNVDGVVIVVEAGQSRRDEILNAQRTIEASGGKFLGYVLNKRRYPVPRWRYKRL